MRKTILNIGMAVSMATALTACGDFLEQRSQNMAYVEEVKDLDELLMGECYLPGEKSLDSLEGSKISNWIKLGSDLKAYFPLHHVMDDDATEYLYGQIGTEVNYFRKKAAHVHHWQSVPMLDSELKEIRDEKWSDYYRRIAVLNSILYQLDQMRDGEPDRELCNRVEGEACFLRAQFYFYLANMYARPYCKATVATDVCVPLKISGEVEDRLFERSPMADVWNQISADLQQAIEALRGIPFKSPYRVRQAAAFALLSRVCLYTERYEEAVRYADSVLLKGEYDLLDLNFYRSGNSAVYGASTETMFTMGPNTMGILHTVGSGSGKTYLASGYTSSDELMNCYDADDLRLKAFFIKRQLPGDGFCCQKMRHKADEISDIMAIRLPEVYLNKAEALAQLGRGNEARTTLQDLRTKRFAPDKLTEIQADGKELVQFIRDERRRELCYEGHRWFDLRRYAVNTECPYTKSITHVSLAYAEGSGVYVEGQYTLKPYSEDAAAWMMPIPQYAIDFNEGRLKNEIRNERPMEN